MAFFEKYQQIIKQNKSYVCVGLDTEFLKLPACLKNETSPALTFNKAIIDATRSLVAAYKPNFAFYISRGRQGLDDLIKTIEHIPPEIPIILDVKSGDIGNTMTQYAAAFLREFKTDAITINTLMGSDVIDAVMQIHDAYAFALTLTSNKSTSDFFYHGDLYKKIAEQVRSYGTDKIGAVVGATRTEDLETMRKLMPETIFLIPGIGAQGGDLESVCKYASASSDDARFLINSSRGIIFADSSEKFAERAGEECEKLRKQANIAISE
jgi:orotidine-5'-phosphate decarboxylase